VGELVGEVDGVLLITKMVLDEAVVVAVLLEGLLEGDNVVKVLVEIEELELDEAVFVVVLTGYVVVWLGQVTTPLLAYKLNCLDPPHFAVPVVDAPTEPLQTSVQAFAPLKLVTEEEPKLKTLPP
jgi:hypothetical protein